MRETLSLRFRLTIFYSVFVALILSIVAISVYAMTERSLISSLEERARQALADVSEGAVSEGLRRLPGDTYFESVIYPPFIVSLDEPSDLKNGYKPPTPGRPNPSNEDIYKLLADSDYEQLFASHEVSTRVSLENGRNLLVIASRAVLSNAGREYPGLLLVGVPANSVTSTLNQLRSTLIITVVFAFGLFAIGVWLLSSQALFPVKRVTQVAAQIGGQDLSQRVPVPKTRDEVGELAVTINRMLDRLQESFETQRRFTADASHELRTPVTAISGHASYLLRRTKPSAEQIDSLTVIRREAERMAKLVNDLLELARADAGFNVEKNPMNLVEVVEAVHMEIAPVAGNAEVTVSSPQPLIEVMGDASRLKQVLLNLVHNALDASSSHVAISVAREKQQVRLEVFDDGPGIPADAIPHIFERFYRVDGARSTRGNGSGLGLAIVKWIVQQHEGTVSVESKLGEGTVFTVMLPALNPKQTETVMLPGLRSSTA